LLTGIEPIVYTTDTISIERDYTSNGPYKVTYTTVGTTGSVAEPWGQQNYFATTKAHTLLKVDIYGYDATGSLNGYEKDAKLANCYAYQVENSGQCLSLFYTWSCDTETTPSAGINVTVTAQLVTYSIASYATITVNQKKNALCLTHLTFDFFTAINWGDLWHYNCGFKLYDIYGNTGTFSAGFSYDRSLLVIGNANNPSDRTYGSSTAPIQDSLQLVRVTKSAVVVGTKR